MNIFELDKQYIAGTYPRFPLEVVGGSGSLISCGDDKTYIDFVSGIAVNTFGLCDAEWNAAVTKQLSKYAHTSNFYHTRPCVDLAKLLCEKSGLKKTFFANSGTEANECAYKAARRFGEREKGEGHTTIVTLKNSFHGRTFASLAASGQDIFHQNFLPMIGGFVYAEPNDLNSVEQQLKNSKCCAVMFEVVQGEGGMNPLRTDFLEGLKTLAERYNVLLMADEVQVGIGRSGKFFGYQNFDLLPDIVTAAKGLGNGLPIGACIMGARAEGLLGIGDHGSTFGGNPVCCAGAVNVVERVDAALLSGVKEKSEYILSELRGAKGIKSVSGMGLMLGIETERSADDIVKECLKRGLFVIKAKHKVRLLPPLNIPNDLLKKGIEIIKRSAAK